MAGRDDFSVANLKQVEASSSAPEGLEARLAREQIESEHLGVSYFHYAPGVRTPFGHSHVQQEEAYVVVSGSGRARVGEEIVELRRWDVIRIAPQAIRAFEGGPEGMELIAIGSDLDVDGEGETVPDFWTDE